MAADKRDIAPPIYEPTIHEPIIYVTDILSTSQFARLVKELVREVEQPNEPGWFMTGIENLSRPSLQYFVTFMETRGFPVELPDDPNVGLKKSEMLAEVHFAQVDGYRINSGLACHQDNFGGVCGKVHTMLVYFCHTAKCGGLYYWTGDKDPEVSGQRPELLSTVPPEGCMRVVLLNGKTWHIPQYVEGRGVRGVLVLQFPKRRATQQRATANDVALAYAAVAGDSGPSARASKLFGMPFLVNALDECSAIALSGLILQPAQFVTPSAGL